MPTVYLVLKHVITCETAVMTSNYRTIILACTKSLLLCRFYTVLYKPGAFEMFSLCCGIMSLRQHFDGSSTADSFGNTVLSSRMYYIVWFQHRITGRFLFISSSSSLCG